MEARPAASFTMLQWVHISCVVGVTSLCVFRTERGYLGFGDEAVALGDAVTILYGLGSSVILRREAAAWQLLGPCFGVGIMLDEGTRQNPPEEDFRIEYR
jgi:hypothetical protein